MCFEFVSMLLKMNYYVRHKCQKKAGKMIFTICATDSIAQLKLFDTSGVPLTISRCFMDVIPFKLTSKYWMDQYIAYKITLFELLEWRQCRRNIQFIRVGMSMHFV